MKTSHKTLGLAALTLALTACASSSPPLGPSTRAWTDLQRSNVAALGWARPMPGDAADKVYQRYLNSFGQPIPETFTRKPLGAE